MARVKIELPSTWAFHIDIPVRITDINYGNHLGNDSFLSILHEARMRWIHQHGWTELNIEKTGLIMVDMAVRFKSEAVFGDVLRVHLTPVDWTNLGFDLVYLATNATTGAEVARAQSGMIFFDYTTRRLTSMPPVFREKMG
jgi:acyl-CoA thioesterase FadM